MPLDNTTRAIKRGTGEMPGMQYEEQSYEGYGPFGTAVVVDALTDNKNRTVAELRRIFTSSGGSLAETGSVNWMFARMGVIQVSGTTSEDSLLEMLLDYDIKDISYDGEMFSITCDPKIVDKIKNILQQHGLKVVKADVEWVAQNTVALSPEQEEKAYEFLSSLEDHEDVQNVYTNLA